MTQVDRENDQIKHKIEYGVWLGDLTTAQLRALASQVGLRDWLSLTSTELIGELKEHGKAQTIWAKAHGLVDALPIES